MSLSTHPPAIDIAIVNWNTAEAALAAADAYRASVGVETKVTIVDNASSKGQRRLLEAQCPPGVRLQLNDANLGYGAAANLALAGGAAEMVCVSNADVLPEPEALATLIAAVREESKAGMAGPAFGGKTDRYHAKLPGAVAMLGRIFIGSFARGAVATPLPGETKEVAQPSGACFVTRRETWERIGGFDEGFFLWYEDVDLARRLRDSGYVNLVVGSARVRHTGARSFVQLDRRRLQSIRLASVERYIRKHQRRIMPFARPLLRLSRRLRARGAT